MACALAAGLLGALTPALAQAHEYKVEGKPVSAYTRFRSAGEQVLIKGTPLGVTTEYLCTASAEGGLEPAGAAKLFVHYQRCTVRRPYGCEFKNGELNSELKSVLGGQPGAITDELTAVGTNWAEWEFAQSETCSLAGKTFSFAGSQTCELEQAALEQELHAVECRAGGSHLKFGGKAAALQWGLGVYLVNESGEATKKNWSAS